MFLLGRVHHLALMIENDEARAGGPLVNGGDVLGHLLPPCAEWSGGAPANRRLGLLCHGHYP
jgi:hypothetical protein